MLQWILVFNILDIAYSHRRIYIARVDTNNNLELPLPTSIIEVTPGTNLTLRCALSSNQIISDPSIIWGRRTKDMQFQNEHDLYQLLEDENQHILDLINKSNSSGYKHFVQFKNSDRGSYFCMSRKYMLFKVVHIKVSLCSDDKFKCISNGFCISSHYRCDGKEDCHDGSDEFWELCDGDPCEGKVHCNDGRCIPKAWCCDRRTDDYCLIVIRHHCCPFLPNPYDPLNWYNKLNATKEITKGSGPRYLFIAVCVVSAILSFVLFLFIISKVCGFDKKPQRLHDQNTANELPGATVSNCGHSECAIRRELAATNISCLYRSEEVSDPLIAVNISTNNDRPPSYAEVVNMPPNIDKSTLEDLINAPPPPYSSTKNIASNSENNIRCDTNL